jgi:anti-anti-sigma factor
VEDQPSISVGHVGDVAVVGLVGDHDIVTAADVRNALEAELAEGHGLVVSLADTTFFDSSIAHALFGVDTGLRESGRRLVLHVGTPSIVERVLEISGLDARVQRTSSLADAVALAGRRPGRVGWTSP